MALQTGGIPQMVQDFDISQELAIAGVSLYVLGFAVGPIFWGPYSEVAGRQFTHLISYGVFVAFNAGVTAAQNIQTVLVCRFLAGSFGAASLTNAGVVIADIFSIKERGLAMSLFASAPFMGPVVGPILSGFLSEAAGWRWVSALMTILSAIFFVLSLVVIPETYAPVILSSRAKKLSKITGKSYRSHFETEGISTAFGKKMQVALTRPWVFVFCELIVFLLSVYMSIVYAILYLLFAAFPVVYQKKRGWSQGLGGLAFLGVAVGVFVAVGLNVFINNHYRRLTKPTPESRLPASMLGAIAVTVGLFWFAWSNGPSTHWLVSVSAGGCFGFGMVLNFLSINSYLVDAYTIYAASVLAGGTVMRSFLAAAFPLFTPYMYSALGIHWASSIPAFLALACTPMPFFFYYYGPAIRSHSKFASC